MAGVTSVLLEGLMFPEGPRWHDGKLWFSDMHAHRVMTVDPSGRAETVCEVAEWPSGLRRRIGSLGKLGLACSVMVR